MIHRSVEAVCENDEAADGADNAEAPTATDQTLVYSAVVRTGFRPRPLMAIGSLAPRWQRLL